MRWVLLAVATVCALAGCGSHPESEPGPVSQQEIAARAAALPSAHGPDLSCASVGRALRLSAVRATTSGKSCFWRGAHPGYVIVSTASDLGTSAATSFVEQCSENLFPGEAQAVVVRTLRQPACWQPEMRLLTVYDGAYLVAIGVHPTSSPSEPDLADSVATAKALGL